MTRQDPDTDSTQRPRRVAVVGLGASARMFTEALTGPFADRIDLVGLCDTTRIAWASTLLAGQGARSFSRSPA